MLGAWHANQPVRWQWLRLCQRLLVTLRWFLPSTVWQCFVDFKLKDVELGVVKELPENRLASCSIAIIMHKHSVFCRPRPLCPVIDFECVDLLYTYVCCISKPVRRKYADRLLNVSALFAIAEPHVLRSGIQLQVVYGRSKLCVDDVEVSARRPIVPKINKGDFVACSVLKKHCMKLIGPDRGLRGLRVTDDNCHVGKYQHDQRA